MAILSNYIPYFKDDNQLEIWSNYCYIMQLSIRLMRLLMGSWRSNTNSIEIEYIVVQTITNLIPYIEQSKLYDDIVDEHFFTDICNIIERRDYDAIVGCLQLLSAVGAKESCYSTLMQLSNDKDSIIQDSLLSIFDRTIKNDSDSIKDLTSLGVFDWILDTLDSQNCELKLKCFSLILTICKCGVASFVPEKCIQKIVDNLNERNSTDTLKIALLIICSYLENDFEFINLESKFISNLHSLSNTDNRECFGLVFHRIGGTEALANLTLHKNRDLSEFSRRILQKYFRKSTESDI